MSVSNIIASDSILATDECYVVELWRASSDPPYHTALLVPMFEGGIVDSATGDTITFNGNSTRQVLDPSDRSFSYQTQFTKSQVGRKALITTGAMAGECYDITGYTAYSVTCDGVDFTDLSASDVVVICDKLPVLDCSADWSIGKLCASANFTIASDKDGVNLNLVQPESWIYWRKKLVDDSEDSGWFTMGWFEVSRCDDSDEVKSVKAVAQCSDALKWFNDQSWYGTYSADKIYVPHRYNSAADAVVPLVMIDERSGPLTPPEDGFMRCVDSPETASDAKKLANHTTNWCVLPPPVIYRSADQNATISQLDEVLAIADGLDILYGSGEIRIQGKFYDDNFTNGKSDSLDHKRPYIKVKYYRWAIEPDLVRGTVTSLTTVGTTDDTINDSNLTGSLVLPTAGKGVTGMKVRITSEGGARGKTFTVTANTASTMTLGENLTSAGVIVGDTWELADIQDPKRRLEDLLLATGYQMRNQDLPLYVDTLEDILAESDATAVIIDDSGYTNVTADVTDGTVGTNLPSANNAALYIANAHPFMQVYLQFSSVWATGSWVAEYWNGSVFTTIPSYGYSDGTGYYYSSGTIKWLKPNDWAVTTVDGVSDELFWIRLRNTSDATGTATLTRLTLMGRPSAESPLTVLDVDAAPPSGILSKWRSSQLIPPNYVLYADYRGRIEGSNVTQSAATNWTYTRQTAARRTRDSTDIKTGVLYRGWSSDISNIAMDDGTVTISETSEVTTLMNEKPDGSPYTPVLYGVGGRVNRGPANDDYLGIGLIIDGVDLRPLCARIAGSQFEERWGYCSYVSGVAHDKAGYADSNQYLHYIDDCPLWQVDFGSVITSFSSITVVIDGNCSPFVHHDDAGRINPVVALDVSSDGSIWVPLSDSASAISIDSKGTKEYTFASNDKNWQFDFRYLRYRCVVGGVVWSYGWVAADSGMVVVLKCYRSQELRQLSWLSDTAPYSSSTVYSDRYRRYGRKLQVQQAIDYSASNDLLVARMARRNLAEFNQQFPNPTIDGIRPDARIFESVSVTEGTLGYSLRTFLLTDLTVGKGVKTSCTMQDFSLLTTE